jgi:serine/threonine protein kinase
MGEPVLTDFGIAKLLGTSSNTLSGWWFGTPLYTSPEQAKGYPGNERSDLYSLGVILYEICTGVLPFHGENAAAILMQHVNATPTSPVLINPSIPPALTLAILRSIAKDPEARFPSAAAMTIAVAEALNLPIPEALGQRSGQNQPSYSVGVISDPKYSAPVQPYLTPNLTPSIPSQATIQNIPSFPTLQSVGQGFTPPGGVSGASPMMYSAPGTPVMSTPSTPLPDASHYFMVQEYVGGENLKDHLDRLNQPMEEREVLSYATQVLDILNGLAKQTPPVVHGDIKPANIVIGAKDRRAHLIGFGGALADMNNQPKHTPTPAGTAGYAPLEQLQGNADSRSDLYGLAATMHHLLTNRNPRNNPPFIYPLASMLNPQLSLEVERVLVRGLSNDITQRYQSASEMKRDIDDILLRRYGMSGDMNNFALGFSGPIGAISTTNPSTGKKVTARLGEMLHLPGAVNTEGTALANSTGAASLPPGTYQPQPVQQKRRGFLRNILIVVLLILLVIGGLSYTLLSIRNNHSSTTVTNNTGTQTGLGIGVTKAADGEYIGLSDGTFAFDTNRIDGNLMRQAAARLNAKDVNGAESLWQQAAAQDTSDAEPLIYLEDQRVLASGYPYITLVIGTFFDPADVSVGRGDLQGAYVVQKEYNDGFKLPAGTQVRLLVANTGNLATYAKPVAQQIVQAARTDKTILGVMGWPYSSRTLNAINILAAAHIPMVSQTATSVVLSGISPYFFRVAPPDTSQAAAGARYVEQTLHDKAVALFEDPTDSYSKSLGEAFKRQFTADGNSIVVTEQYTVDKPETLASRLQDALTHNPDLIYFSGYSKDVSVLLSDLPTSGQFANLLVMGGDGLYVLSGYSQEAHANLGRLRFTALAYPDEWDVQHLTLQKPPFFRDYPEHYDPGGAPHPSPYGYSRPDSEAMLAFDGTLALLEGSRIALIGGKNILPDDLRHALTTITGSNAIQGVSGQIAFGPDGNPVDKAVVVLAVTPGGRFQMQGVQGTFLKVS